MTTTKAAGRPTRTLTAFSPEAPDFVTVALAAAAVELALEAEAEAAAELLA